MLKQFRPEYPTVIMDRIAEARDKKTQLTLFIPWGVRIDGQFGDNELKVMSRIQSLQEQLQKRRINTEVLLMPADLYATEVNNQVNPAQSENYFATVSEAAKNKFGFTVKPWSEIRTENLGRYQARAEQLTEDAIRRLLTKQKVTDAIDAAGRRSGYQETKDIQAAAFRYLRERIIEAEIVDDTYNPVKVSAVPRNKDNEIDGPLPRLYLFSSEEQFPWLK
jgi:hypothetical protein